MALCISSMVRHMTYVNILSFSLFTFAVIFSSVANDNSAGAFWNDAYSPVETTFWKIIFFLMPWFHYNKIFNNILTVTKVQGLGLGELAASPLASFTTAEDIQNAEDNNASVIINVTKNSTYYKWERIYEPVGTSTGEPFPEKYDINGDSLGGTWYAPSVHDSMMYMFALNVIYFILAWYLGQVLSGDLGAAKKPWYVYIYSQALLYILNTHTHAHTNILIPLIYTQNNNNNIGSFLIQNFGDVEKKNVRLLLVIV